MAALPSITSKTMLGLTAGVALGAGAALPIVGSKTPKSPAPLGMNVDQWEERAQLVTNVALPLPLIALGRGGSPLGRVITGIGFGLPMGWWGLSAFNDSHPVADAAKGANSITARR